MKIILILIIILSFVYMAFQVKGYYSKRCEFYASFVGFINILSSEISFLKSDFATIVKSNNFGNGVDKILDDYLNKKNLSLQYMSTEEIEDITKFLDSVGKNNVQGELNNIQFYLNQFKSKLDKCNDEKTSRGSLWFKLICLGGLLLVIVLI